MLSRVTQLNFPSRSRLENCSRRLFHVFLLLLPSSNLMNRNSMEQNAHDTFRRSTNSPSVQFSIAAPARRRRPETCCVFLDQFIRRLTLVFLPLSFLLLTQCFVVFVPFAFSNQKTVSLVRWKRNKTRKFVVFSPATPSTELIPFRLFFPTGRLSSDVCLSSIDHFLTDLNMKIIRHRTMQLVFTERRGERTHDMSSCCWWETCALDKTDDLFREKKPDPSHIRGNVENEYRVRIDGFSC